MCAGKTPRKLVAASVARSQLKRHRVDAAAECVHALLVGCDAPALDLSVEEADVLEHGLNSLDARMQAHFDRAVRWPSTWLRMRWCVTCAIPV